MESFYDTYTRGLYKIQPDYLHGSVLGSVQEEDAVGNKSVIGDFTVYQGALQSGNYSAVDETGWRLDSDGNFIVHGDADISGSITATSGSIGGWEITTSNLRSASSGERLELDSKYSRIKMYNQYEEKILQLYYGTSASNPVIALNIDSDSRRGIEILTSTDVDDDAVFIYHYGTNNAINIRHKNTGSTAAAISIDNDSEGPGIDITTTGSGDNSHGLYISHGATDADAAGIKVETDSDITSVFLLNSDGGYGIEMDYTGGGPVEFPIKITRASDTSYLVSAIKLDVSNNSGEACGIDFYDMGLSPIFKVYTNNTDPTGGGGAATGRIPIKVGGVTRYLAYY